MAESGSRQALPLLWPRAHPGSIILTNVKCRTRPFGAGCRVPSRSCQGVIPWVARRSVQNERGFLHARLLGCAHSSDLCFRHGSIHAKHGDFLGRGLPCRGHCGSGPRRRWQHCPMPVSPVCRNSRVCCHRLTPDCWCCRMGRLFRRRRGPRFIRICSEAGIS